jgi:large subunit ribosomal protein L6
MSRIGQQPVSIPPGIAVNVTGRTVGIKGPKGDLSYDLPEGIEVKVEGAGVVLTRSADDQRGRSLHGLARSLVANMVKGVEKGFSKELELQGVGFKAAVEGRKLLLSLGFAGPVEYVIPEGIKITVEAGTALTVSGPSKELVGTVAARIRAFFPAEPYKGKGLRYRGEYVRRKVGKTVA